MAHCADSTRKQFILKITYLKLTRGTAKKHMVVVFVVLNLDLDSLLLYTKNLNFPADEQHNMDSTSSLSNTCTHYI